MSQDRMHKDSTSGSSSLGGFQAPNIDASLSQATQAMKKVRVVHGANQEYLDLEGKTVGYVRKKLRDVLNIPGDAEALIAGKAVGDEFILEGNQSLEFVKEAGVKGLGRFLMALLMIGVVGHAQGAMSVVKTPVPAVTYVSPSTKGNIRIWRGWITIIFPDGRRTSGYADWRGYPDTIPLGDPNTWIFSGSGMNWHLLSEKEKRGIAVILVEIDLGYSNGPYTPGSKSTGL